MISQYIAEVPLNISSILKTFKYFIKKVYLKEWTQNIEKKNDQNNYFRAETSKNKQQLLRLQVKKKIGF